MCSSDLDGAKTALQRRLDMAHSNFWKACIDMSDINPSGMRELLGMYDLFLRAECGACVSRQSL